MCAEDTFILLSKCFTLVMAVGIQRIFGHEHTLDEIPVHYTHICRLIHYRHVVWEVGRNWRILRKPTKTHEKIYTACILRSGSKQGPWSCGVVTFL